MLRYSFIAGLALLWGAFFAPCGEACAGLFAPDQFAPDTVWAEAASADASTTASAGGSLEPNDAGNGERQEPATPPTDEPNDHSSDSSGVLRRLASQPAQGSSGATGSGASVTGGIAPLAILSAATLPSAAEPSDRCVERENAALPAPPTSELLRPPRHAS